MNQVWHGEHLNYKHENIAAFRGCDDMAYSVCLDCVCSFKISVGMSWNTKNMANHHIVIIANGNRINGVEARQ